MVIEQLAGALERWLGITPDITYRAVYSAMVVVAYGVGRRVTRRVLLRWITDPESRYQINKALTYFTGFIAIAVMAKIWFQGLTGLATYFGLLSAGLAISLQDPLTNLAGWLFIVTRRPFEVGDRIQIGAFAGDVVDIRIFRFLVLEIGNWVHADQATGRVIHIPNGQVFKLPVASYDGGFGYIWNEIEVLVTFESNWKRAKQVLVDVLGEHAEKLSPEAMQHMAEAAEGFHVKLGKVTPVVWTSAEASGVRLTMRYLCKPRERRSSTSEVWEAVLEELALLDDVDLAYPTTRYFDETREGKKALRSPPSS